MDFLAFLKQYSPGFVVPLIMLLAIARLHWKTKAQIRTGVARIRGGTIERNGDPARFREHINSQKYFLWILIAGLAYWAYLFVSLYFRQGDS